MLTTLRKWIVGVSIMLISSTVYAGCLKEGDSVELKGVMKEEMSYGPPGWGEDTAHDERIHQWILYLNTPLTCVINANTESTNWNKKVQLAPANYKERELIGNVVTVTGKLFLAWNGYHSTPVLLGDVKFINDSK